MDVIVEIYNVCQREMKVIKGPFKMSDRSIRVTSLIGILTPREISDT